MKKHQLKFRYIGVIWFLLLLFIILLFSIEGFSQIKEVWALGDGEKVFRYDLDHPSKNGNYTWDRKTVHLKGLCGCFNKK